MGIAGCKEGKENVSSPKKKQPPSAETKKPSKNTDESKKGGRTVFQRQPRPAAGSNPAPPVPLNPEDQIFGGAVYTGENLSGGTRPTGGGSSQSVCEGSIADVVECSSVNLDWLATAETEGARVRVEKSGVLVWLDGIWKGGAWVSGVWQNGMWEQGQWQDGTWKSGYWRDGTWLDGIWEGGTWASGLWQNGVWKRGIWRGGVWQNGTWFDGSFYKGIWEDGLWQDGIWWEHAIWRGGIWKWGTIYMWNPDENNYISIRGSNPPM